MEPSSAPNQLQERSQVAENVKPWDKRILAVYTALLPTVFITAGLDAGRFRWSAVPAVIQGIAWVGIVSAAGIDLLDNNVQHFLIPPGTHSGGTQIR